MLMIKTSTKLTNSLPEEMVTPMETTDQIGEEELSFYSSIKKELGKLEVNPKTSVIDNIMKYSRSL